MLKKKLFGIRRNAYPGGYASKRQIVQIAKDNNSNCNSPPLLLGEVAGYLLRRAKPQLHDEGLATESKLPFPDESEDGELPFVSIQTERGGWRDSMPPNIHATGDIESMSLLAGQSVGLVNEILPACRNPS